MFFLQSVQAPFVFTLNGDDGKPCYVVKVPRYTIGDAIEWGVVLAERWRAEQTKDLKTENERRDFNQMHPAYPLTPADLKVAVGSVEGAKEVINDTIPKAKVYKAAEISHVSSRKVDGKEKKFKTTRWDAGEDITSPQTTKDVLNRVLVGNGASALCRIAWEIADLRDISPQAPVTEEEVVDEEGQEERKESPLADIAKQD